MAAPSWSRGRDFNSITIPVVLAVCASATAATPQFISGVNVVEVYASVTDPAGEPVTVLTRGDFQVFENGERQIVSTFAAGDFPLTVALAVDRSFSMAGERLSVAKSAAGAFLGDLRPDDESLVLAVGSQVEIIAPLSTNRSAHYAALSGLDAFGTTGLHDAIIRAIELTQPGKGRRALVLLSDGEDRYSRATAGEALQRARSADVMIYAVALGRTRPALFAELATLTGGRSFHVRDPGRLGETLRSIARELRHQYLLGYTPSRPLVAGSGEWRAITVKVDRPGARVRARNGYLVR